ncbi:hypothetical protein [Rhizobium sp. S96]|uniref:hypothetical protein n=1 Tax=Rhizobium sp. S96 TaxID=3055140 RepID=UPI0025AACDDA|nr:hypothetical protein [Rhizobium sp. S96]MDM9623516.1 hypothetical protein [Rhizobium sp. S96]
MTTYESILLSQTPNELFDLNGLSDKGGVLTLSLFNADEATDVRFNAYYAYRKIDEGDALKLLSDVASSSQLGKTLYRGADSEFTRWFREQGLGKNDDVEVHHVVIILVDDVIEILTPALPVIENMAR